MFMFQMDEEKQKLKLLWDHYLKSKSHEVN